MHPHFTEIPQRSFEKIVKNGWLTEVLLALITDPLEAEDTAESIKSRTETAIELKVNDQVFSAPIGPKDFQTFPSKDAFEKLKITLSQWVMTTNGANDALLELTTWDARFSVWCSCAVARDALRFVPNGEQRPLQAIGTAEAWVMGRAALKDVRRASTAANRAPYYATAAAITLHAALAAADERGPAVAEQHDAATAAAAVAAFNVTAYGSPEWSRIRDEELIRLREVVANACFTFPG